MFYVYVYLNPLKPGKFEYGDINFQYEPMYIGKGHKNRMLDHLRNAKKPYMRSHFISKLRQILKMNIEPIIFKVCDNMVESEAFALEKLLITRIGRLSNNTGPLFNYTDGGEGCTGYKHDPAHIEYMKKLHRTDEWRENIKKSLTGKKHPSERRYNNKMAQMGLQAGKKNPRAMTFVFKDPHGIDHTIVGSLKIFCKQNNLRMGTMIDLHKGVIKSYKGWTFVSKTKTICS